MIYTTAELLQRYEKYGDPKGKIRRLVNKGELIPIKNGLYEDNMNINPAYIAPWIYSPSYLSFDYVLYIYDIIPETVYTLTSATYNKKKMKSYKTPFGLYTYQDIPKSAYPYCVNAKIDENYSYLIATCEKALCDKLYTLKPVKNLKEIEYLLFNDLRIDQDDFWSLKLEDMLFLAPLYHSTNLKYLYRLINGGIRK